MVQNGATMGGSPALNPTRLLLPAVTFLMTEYNTYKSTIVILLSKWECGIFLTIFFGLDFSECACFLRVIVKVWSEDGAGKVVEIPADMTARDVCQLLVYKSHCVDDNAWTLVEHHPVLGLGKETCPNVALME
ncbi:hypothetical protein XENOCAPTIV_017725 [Xenoophorus captivus]|uniref:Ras-associating domain-containing protein n=1 Tax=Xenoophorus captivus TaxID=1517983 RepID=A0ABV0RLH5_9TELE